MVRLRAAAAALAVVGGVAGAVAIGGLSVVGCGDTNGGGTTDDGAADQTAEGGGGGGPDVGLEAHPDMGTMKEAGGDATLDTQTGPDARSDADATVTEGGDVNVQETSAEADAANSPDADAGAAMGDAAPDSNAADALDAADAWDGWDGGPNGFQQYATQYANAICNAFRSCCGATFDVAACKSTLYVNGYDNSLPTIPATYTSGHLTFNQTQAAACITALNAWPCGATITSAQNQAVLTACHGVLGGTLPIGSLGCLSSYECVSGAYCGASDAGSNKCIALADSGGPCAQGESPDNQCSYIGTALPALYCNIYPSDGGPSSGSGTCQPAQANGAASRCTDGVQFSSDYACTGGLCDPFNTGACAATAANPADPVAGYECGNFVLDAGGGG